jgi:hypothetical protein
VWNTIPVGGEKETLRSVRRILSAERIGGLVHNVWYREADLAEVFQHDGGKASA